MPCCLFPIVINQPLIIIIIIITVIIIIIILIIIIIIIIRTLFEFYIVQASFQ